MQARLFAALVSAAVLSATSAMAQAPAAQPGPNNPAVSSPGVNNSKAPVEGANSFTEGQAKSRIEAQGYTNVTNLMKDDKGVWRAKASKGGAASDVSLDFQGNINPVK
jgi:hypothetical protein